MAAAEGTNSMASHAVGRYDESFIARNSRKLPNQVY